MHRAYSLLHVKAVDSDQRTFTGWATTPEPDRVGDIVDPLGVEYKNPLPLLLFHDATKPVGRVTFATATAKGIPFSASIPDITEAGTLKDRADEAWQSVKYGLINGVSIGFRAFSDGVEHLKSGGVKFLRTEVLELSLVPIPANASAVIQTIKSLDVGRAASGTESDLEPRTPAGVTAPVIPIAQKGARAMTHQERITALENKRAATSAAMEAIQQKVFDEGRTKEAGEREQFDTLKEELQNVDAELNDAREMERLNISKATPIMAPVDPIRPRPVATDVTRSVHVKTNLPPGIGLARYAMAVVAGNGDSQRTVEYAKQWRNSTPEVELVAKAAVAAGTTTDATWAGPLALAKPLVENFLEFLRPQTLIGQNLGFQQVPFNVSVGSQTSGGAYGWVGQGSLKPVTKLDFATVTLGINKAAAIIAISDELARSSSPSAEMIVRDQMVKGIANFLDTQLLDPAVAEVAGVNPASITNGATSTASAGPTAANSRTDLVRELTALTAAEFNLNEVVIFMNQANAFAIGISLNAFGQPLFPGMGVSGGSFQGARIITSGVVGNKMVFVHAPSILFADDGVTQIDLSREASIIMNDAPNAVVQAAGAAPIHLSLWQANMLGIRAERWITWKRARTAAVRVVTAVAYTGA